MEVNHNYLVHYASPYYDPVKAHEYYEEHKKLKGRRSTAGLSEEGRIAAAYIKKRLSDERKSKIDSHKKHTEASIKSIQNNVKTESEAAQYEVKDNAERLRRTIESHNNEMNSQIAQLQSKLKNIGNSAARNSIKREVAAKIASLREKNAKQRETLQNEAAIRNYKIREQVTNSKESAKGNIKSLRSAHKSYSEKAKSDYESKLESEIENLKGAYGRKRKR